MTLIDRDRLLKELDEKIALAIELRDETMLAGYAVCKIVVKNAPVVEVAEKSE